MVTGKRRTASSRGRCEPDRSARSSIPWVAVRVRLQLAKAYAALADQATARHLLREIDDILLHRPALGALVDEVSEFREVLTSSAQVTVAGGPPLSPAELRLLPYLQTHLTFKQIGERLFVSRNTVSSEVGSIYRKLGVSSRSDAVQRATDGRPARRVAEITHQTLFQGIVDVVAKRHRQTRRRRDNTGSPTTETTPSSTSTISAAVAPALTAASASAP